MPTKLLFICSRNQWRSPTAETIYRKAEGYATRSRGTSKRAVRHVSASDLRWADLIFAMEPKHAQRLRAEHPQALRHKKPIVLHIPDNYRYMDPALIQRLRAEVDPILAAQNPLPLLQPQPRLDPIARSGLIKTADADTSKH